MRTNRKTEEKKMSMNMNIARLAVTAGLTAALSFGGVMAPVTMAFAEGDANGSVTIGKALGNDTEFMGYKIFDADVAKDENGQTLVSNIAWANDKVEAAVKKAIEEFDTDANIATAQDAADWISEHVMHTGKTTSVTSDSAAYKIATAVAKVTDLDDPSDYAATSNGVANNLSHGYWLFVTDALTVAGTETATAPIFAVIGDEAVSITEKTSIPTVDKQVFEGTEWGKVSDSQIGEKIEYKLIGTVADNIDTFATYKYVFQDHLSVGLKADKDSVAVTIDDKTVQPAGNYSVQVKDAKDESNNVTGHDLTISFDDLKAAAKASNVTLTKTSKVVVTYKAELTSDAEYTATGNTNKVELVYSNNPMTSVTGTSTSKEVTDYVFGLDITKVEEGNQDKKLVAGFKVKVVNNGDSESADKWLKNDGTLVGTEEEASEFMTDNANGKVFIPGLVAGTYEITETTTPSGYNAIAPFRITVTPTYDAKGNLSGLTVSDTSNMVQSEMANKSVTTTKIPVTIQNKKSSGLPLTGLNGVTFTWIAGGAVLCIGVAHLIRSRKQAEESEQE